MKHFVLNNQKLINSYNFYLLNSGARMERFAANAPMLDNHSSDRLIGRWNDIKFEGDQMLAMPDFDEGIELGRERKGQVEREYLKGASLGIIIYGAEWRLDIDGAERLYITDWEPFEASVTPIPSNAGALSLMVYDTTGTPVPEKKLQLHIETLTTKLKSTNINEKTMEKVTLTADALAKLGLTESADQVAVSAAVIKLATRVVELETQITKQQAKRATDMVTLAVTDGRITADKKEAFVKLAMADFESTQSALETMPQKASLSSSIAASKGAATPGREKWTLSQWLREDPAELQRIKNEEPDTLSAILAVK